MADALKILAQNNPAATTWVDIYTVPASTATSISSLVVCNIASSATTFRIAAGAGGNPPATAEMLYYDITIQGNQTFVATIGITLETGKKIAAYAGNGNLVFNAFGVEVS